MLKTTAVESMCENLTVTISFMNIGLQFESFLRHLRDSAISNAEDIERISTCDKMLGNISKELFKMQSSLGKLWAEHGPIQSEYIPYLVSDPDLKRILALFGNDLNSLVQLAIPIEEKPIADKSSEIAPISTSVPISYETIYRTNDIIGSFAVNTVFNI